MTTSYRKKRERAVGWMLKVRHMSVPFSSLCSLFILCDEGDNLLLFIPQPLFYNPIHVDTTLNA